MSLRKFFKFPVEKPIDVRTKFFSTEDNLVSGRTGSKSEQAAVQCEDVYLEAQIQNLCSAAITLERVDLQPSAFYKRNDAGLNTLSKSSKQSIQLNPQDIYQFLFCLSPKLAEHSYAQFRGESAIGNLDIRWRTQMGEPGRLQTSQLTRVAPSYGDLRLLIEKIPGEVRLKELFQVECRVLNCSERSLDLLLTLDNDRKRPFLFASSSGVHLVNVLPNNSAQFHLEVLPLETGVQFLSGIRITNTFLKRTCGIEEVAQILVNRAKRFLCLRF
ncbi:Transcription factor BTF3 [Aphelenchoides fujianensis]|nr:Transcription factor BTF3 [Aphelenchoides fujianensis]